MADPEEIKRKLRELQSRLDKTRESLEKARQRIDPQVRAKPLKKNPSAKGNGS